MSYTINTLLKGERPTYSSATVLQDFVYVSDCVKAIMLILNKNMTEDLYYIGTGNVKMLKEYLLEVGNIINPQITLGIGERPDDGTVYNKEWFDISKLQEDTGYISEVSFSEGIKRTIK